MFADILINHAYSRKQESFTYKVPEELKVREGSGVIVPFQRGKKPGLILRLHKERPEFQTKNIEGLIDPSLLLRDWQVQLGEWIVEHYFCSRFDAFRLMLPKHVWRLPKSKSGAAKKKSGGDLKEQTSEQMHEQTPEQIREQTPEQMHELTKAQEEIISEIIKKKPKTSLIHGITGSGKTEIYKRLIKNCVQNGGQALLLVPEISLTPQLVKYFEACFPELAVIHSRVSEGKRAELWRKIYEGDTKLIIGSRSSLFSPFKKLGLIIMDEEHEWSYKQDQNPRYHAREAALKTSELTGAQLVFGSATPSIETMFKANSGEYKLFTISERIDNTPLPNVEIVDMREELKAKNFSIFSDKLEQKITATLAAKKQVILFLNRRGSASATICRDCGEAATCPNCDAKLTYHIRKLNHQTLICHHCGLINKEPKTCSNCESPRIKHIGIGTERVETDLKALFPNAKVCRADRDTMGKKDSFKDLHKQLQNHEIDILIGTQMIAKGFDIPNVELVGVILADLGLHIPDFRAAERSFQILTQVAGRAGRRKTRGEVIIQTYSPMHPSVQMAKEHDYLSFYEQEISSRKLMSLPPFIKIIKLTFVNEDKAKCQQASEKLQKLLIQIDRAQIDRAQIDNEKHRIYSAPALISRINRKFHWHVLIQGASPEKLLRSIQKTQPQALDNWRIDVDPIITV